MKNIARSLVLSLLIASTVGPSMAMAYDADRFQELQPEAQRVMNQLKDRFQGFSAKKKARILNGLYQIVLKGASADATATESVKEIAQAGNEIAPTVGQHNVNLTDTQRVTLSERVKVLRAELLEKLGSNKTLKDFQDMTKSASVDWDDVLGTLFGVLVILVIVGAIVGIFVIGPIALLWGIAGLTGLLLVFLAYVGASLISAFRMH